MRNPKRHGPHCRRADGGRRLVAGISVLAASIKASVRDIFNKQFTGDFVCRRNTQGFGGSRSPWPPHLNQLRRWRRPPASQVGGAIIDGSSTVRSAWSTP